MMYLIEIVESTKDDIEEVSQYPANSKIELLKLWSELLALNVWKNYRIYENNVVKLEGVMRPSDFVELEKWKEPPKTSGCEGGACSIF